MQKQTTPPPAVDKSSIFTHPHQHRSVLPTAAGNLVWSNPYGKWYGRFSINLKLSCCVTQQFHFWAQTPRTEKHPFKGT